MDGLLSVEITFNPTKMEAIVAVNKNFLAAIPTSSCITLSNHCFISTTENIFSSYVTSYVCEQYDEMGARASS